MLPEDPAALKVLMGKVEEHRKTRLLSPFEVVEDSSTLPVWSWSIFSFEILFGSETGI